MSNLYAEFVQLISSEATELCEKGHKHVLQPEHALKALDSLGFSSMLPEVQKSLEEWQDSNRGTLPYCALAFPSHTRPRQLKLKFLGFGRPHAIWLANTLLCCKKFFTPVIGYWYPVLCLKYVFCFPRAAVG
jgi:hypothetical protein